MATLARIPPVFEIKCRIYQGNVRKRLGEVADQALAVDVVLFRKKPEIVAQCEKPIKECARVFQAADGFEAADHPETACQEDALAGGRPSFTLVVS